NKSGLEAYYLTNLLGNPFETTLAISHLLFSGIMQAYPNLKLLFAHGGGYAPYQKGRLDHGYRVRPEPKAVLTVSPLTDLKKLYFDSITFDPAILRFLVDTHGSDHVLLGSDFPFDMAEDDPLGVLEQTGLSRSEIHRVAGENALQWLGV
ncbi:MAG: amidohydrolase, partial [Alicyclobacillus sp.]|nr:amidohydrolase [Alicyclobacillus sp.]